MASKEPSDASIWKGRLFLIGGGVATVAWALTLYWSLVANRYLDSPWTL